MKALVFEAVDKLPVYKEISTPEVSGNQILLKICASSLNHRDLWITKGQYPGLRSGAIMGADGCGIYEGKTYVINPGLEWGSDSAFQTSTFRVLGVPDDGTFSEYIGIERKYIYPKPQHLTCLQAAALPLAGVTAYRALVKRAQVRDTDTVLISGVGGGVALIAMQFALAIGCKVLVTSGSELKIEKAISLGATAGYLYNDPDWPKKLINDYGGIDVVIDGACGNGFNQLLKVCKPGASIVVYGGTFGKVDGLNPQTVFWKQISILGSTMGSDHDFKDMLDFVTAHRIIPIIETILPLSGYAEGFTIMQNGAQFGKIVFDHQSL